MGTINFSNKHNTTAKRMPNIHYTGNSGKISLSQGNTKLVSNNKVQFLIWNLIARTTCPYATALCKKNCYAWKAERLFKQTYNRNERNTNASKTEFFVNDMISFIESYMQKKSIQGKKILFRIHESGDFYNYEYFVKWVKIADHFKNDNRIIFQAYTKSLPYITQYLQLNNNTIYDINIHFTFSIWNDTKQEYIDTAKDLDLQTFTALKTIPDNYFKCSCVDCGTCQRCYNNTSKNIAVAIH